MPKELDFSEEGMCSRMMTGEESAPVEIFDEGARNERRELREVLAAA